MTLLLIAIGILILSFGAGIAPWSFAQRLGASRLEDITGVASGLLLASALLVVIPEGFHVATEGAAGDEAFAYEPLVLGGTVLLGFVLMLVLEGFGIGHAVHEEHHDHAEGHGHGHVHHPTSSSVLAIGLSIHAMADGLAIGAAAASGEASFSLLVGLAVVLHRVPAAFSLGLFTLHEGSRAAAYRSIGLFAIATPVAMLIAYLALAEASESIVALALLLSAGTFLYVATVDTLPAIHNPETGRRSVRNVLVGAGLFTVLLVLFDAAGLLDHAH